MVYQQKCIHNVKRKMVLHPRISIYAHPWGHQLSTTKSLHHISGRPRKTSCRSAGGGGFRYSWLKMACTFSVPNSDSSWLLLWWIKRFFSPWTVLAVGTETGLVLILSWLVITYSCQILTASLLFGFLMLIVIVYCLLLESDHQQLSIEKYEHWCCHLVFRDDRSRLFNILVYYT